VSLTVWYTGVVFGTEPADTPQLMHAFC